MKYVTVLLSVFMLTVLAQGASATELQPLLKSGTNVSYYDQLKTIFDKSTQPTLEELRGWWSGRCYNISTPNMPENILMIMRYEESSPEQDNGPLFPKNPSEYVYRFALIYGVNNSSVVPAQFFDDMTPEKIDKINDYISENTFSIAGYKNGSVSSSYDHQVEFFIRKFGNYYVAKLVALQDGTLDDGTKYKAGDIYKACYFFKKVHN